jgi:hypothetical protein
VIAPQAIIVLTAATGTATEGGLSKNWGSYA